MSNAADMHTSVSTRPHDLVISSFMLHKKGLTPIGTPTFDEWRQVGEFIQQAESSVHFWLGDWLNYGERRFGEMYAEAVEKSGYDYQTLRNDKWVSSCVELSRRRDNISFEHHKEVAGLEPAVQDGLLDRVEREGMTVDALRKEKHRLSYEASRVAPASVDPGLVRGDCVQVLENLVDESIDLLLTDPPYGLSYLSEHRIVPFDRLKNDGLEEALSILDKALCVAAQKLKTNSHVYVFSAWRVYPQMVAVVGKYFTIKNLLVWEKNNWAAGDLEANYAHKHELIIYAHKGRRHLFGSRDPNVLHFSRVPENSLVHPTEKPVKLLEYLITKSTQEGEVVCDPFMGVGSTCLAAKNTKRKYVGIEIDEKWYKVARERVSG